MTHAQATTKAHRCWLDMPEWGPRSRRGLTWEDRPLLAHWQELLVGHLHASLRRRQLGIQPLLKLIQQKRVALLEL